MSTPILATKLHIPQNRPELVPRPRLMEQLNKGLHRKLTLISAPAGFGKTTLASEWLAGSDRPAAWLSLDKGDNDLNNFLAYLIAAVQTITPGFGESILEALQSPPPVPTEPVLTSLLNEISNRPENFILVLDDYHLINAEPVDEVLSYLIERLPPQMHIVFTTRKDPQLPMAQLRARDQLTELRATDLRFTLNEAADFLSRVMGLNLSAEAVAALETRTEGWIAGLQLAAISIQGQEDADSFIQSFTGSHRFVLDYLVEEILDKQPENIRTFLLRTSILEQLCGSLCNALMDDASTPAQETLEYLERANLLVFPLDDRRQWYRYHHLFADVLQTYLLREHSGTVPGLHRNAVEWYEQNDRPSDAIRHALAVEDHEHAADLIEMAWTDVRRSCFRSPTWLGWVQALPDQQVRVRPVLSVGYAWEFLNFGEMEAAEAQMRNAERWLEPPGDPEGPHTLASETMVVVNKDEYPSLRGSLANAWAQHAQALGDLPGTEKHAQRALALAPETDYFTRGISSTMLGMASWTRGELKAAYKEIDGGISNLRMAGNVLFALSGNFFMAKIRVAQGRLREAFNIYEQALQLAKDQDEVLQGMADLHLGLSELHHEWGDVANARQHLQKSAELGEAAALPDWPHRLRIAQASVKESLGKLDEALELLDEAERLYFSLPAPDVRPITALKARIWIRQGKLDKALAWKAESGLSFEDDLSYLHEFEHTTLASLYIAEYVKDRAGSTIQKAAGLLERLLKAAEVEERVGSQIEILKLQALAHHAQGNSSAALEPLQQALTLAEHENYVQLFVDDGLPMAELLSKANTEGIMPDYTGKLLALFEANKDSAPTQPLSEPLSPRELEILQLIAEGLSNREISERLFLALDTVKGHNRKIFAKLQVQRRTEAVARARELDIL